nr:G protein-coupled receptor [Proales similis]
MLNFLRQIEWAGVIGVGLVTNSLSFLVFACKKLNFEHANHILASIAVSDNLFLLSLLVVNLGIFRINAINQWEPLCKLTVYSGYVSSFVSVWLVVWFTFERFVAVVFPLRALQFGRQRPCILVIVLVGAALYSLTLVTSGIEQIDGHQLCVTLLDWYGVMAVFSLLDTTITMFLPFTLILVLNSIIIINLFPFKTKSRNSASEPSRPSSTRKCEISVSSNSRRNKLSISAIPKLTLKKRRKKYSRTTKMLLLISTTFLFLNFPTALVKLFYFVDAVKIQTKLVNETHHEKIEIGHREELFERIACFTFYLNHSINFFLYSFNGLHLSKVIVAFFRRRPTAL